MIITIMFIHGSKDEYPKLPATGRRSKPIIRI